MLTPRHRSLRILRGLLQVHTAIGLGLFAISFDVVWVVIAFWAFFIHSQIRDLEKTPMFEDARG